jgi:hypothetical protein
VLWLLPQVLPDACLTFRQGNRVAQAVCAPEHRGSHHHRADGQWEPNHDPRMAEMHLGAALRTKQRLFHGKFLQSPSEVICFQKGSIVLARERHKCTLFRRVGPLLLRCQVKSLNFQVSCNRSFMSCPSDVNLFPRPFLFSCPDDLTCGTCRSRALQRGRNRSATYSALNPLPCHYSCSMVSKWTVEVAQAIHFLHTLTPKIIHRDIKPGNVMLDHNHSCKLIDLGLSKTLSHAFTGVHMQSQIFGHKCTFSLHCVMLVCFRMRRCKCGQCQRTITKMLKSFNH